jgi:hypothetical protein
MKHKVLDLRPTQIALGMREVDFRVKKIKDMGKKELDAYLEERKVPVVLAPKDRLLIIDRHHLVRSCWEAGIEEVFVEKKADFRDLGAGELWKTLTEAKWIYPYDQLGHGPHDPIHLPENIKGMADDPYRSLAWAVREEGGFEKCETPFSEFHWANFFRKNLKNHPVAGHYHDALKEALELAKSAHCKHLPGHLAAKKESKGE